jgi:putative GTP pyrophosphokinase
MKENTKEKVLQDFKEARPIYEAFTHKVELLIQELINSNSIQVNSITSRTKDMESFSDKFSKIEGKYNKLEDITDLSGVRIICWFLDQIPNVEQIIRDNFKINNELSIDKREIMDPDRFGYVSIHYIVSFSSARENLEEFKKYSGLYCEIQIRTILQHVWAEIEHDLGYKSKIEIPKKIKRRFYRLEGLIELADDEFQNLREDTESYTNIVTEKIKRAEQDIFIDKISLESYIDNSKIIEKIDNTIASYFGSQIKSESQPHSFETDLKILTYFNISTIKALNEIIEKNENKIIKFAKEWITTKHENASTPKGITIFYLGYILAIQTMDNKKINDYLNLFIFSSDTIVIDRLKSISQRNEY